MQSLSIWFVALLPGHGTLIIPLCVTTLNNRPPSIFAIKLYGVSILVLNTRSYNNNNNNCLKSNIQKVQWTIWCLKVIKHDLLITKISK